jgi:hypothetical protein
MRVDDGVFVRSAQAAGLTWSEFVTQAKARQISGGKPELRIWVAKCRTLDWLDLRDWMGAMSNLLDFIKSIPGLAKAIADLVGDVSRLGSSGAKLGSAKIDKTRRAIEDQANRDSAMSQAVAESEAAITRALGEASVKYIEANACELGERALSYGIDRLTKQQHNREMVVMKTIENLRLDPPQPITKETPSEDWLNLFGRYAENASSDKMREHWAHILAGEIRRPGTFSFITLHLASVLDERLAKIIESFRTWIIERSTIPLIDPITAGDRYSDLITLTGIGFVSLGSHAIYIDDPAKPHEPIEIPLDGGSIRVPMRPKTKVGDVEFPDHRIDIPAAVITPAGIELLNALSPMKQDDRLPSIIMAYLEKQGFKEMTFITKGDEPVARKAD